MTRRERLTATLRAEPVDRPPVCFYELDGIGQNPGDANPFNIFSDPSWQPLLELTSERTDCIHLSGPSFSTQPPNPLADLTTTKTWTDDDGSRNTKTTIRAGGRTLTSQTRQHPDIWTVWTTEHLLKNVDDLKAWLDLPDAQPASDVDIAPFLKREELMGDRGIVAIDTGDPICSIAPLFDLGTFTVIALTEPGLFHRALERAARVIQPQTEAAAEALPGRLWRICGPEYASPPYLPPRLFEEYVTAYDKPMVEAVQKHGGVARIHCHGRLNNILDLIIATGCKGLDPIEPPTQGDVTLANVRKRTPGDLVLFGNIEVSDIESTPADEFVAKVETALRDGPNTSGTAFVLMPSSCPYGRTITPLTLRNYTTMVELTEAIG
jgi:hypothetical protein